MNDRQAVARALLLLGSRTDVVQDTHGNVSAREGSHVFIKPSGVPYNDIVPMDVCELTFDEVEEGWKLVEGFSLKPSVDTVNHVQIYRDNPHVKAICHTHSPYAVAHAIAGMDVKCLSTEQADYFGGDVKCLPYSGMYDWDVHVLKGERAVLLGGHGVLTFADDPVEAVKLAVELENVARKNFFAATLAAASAHGYPPFQVQLNKVEIKNWHKRFTNDYGQR